MLANIGLNAAIVAYNRIDLPVLKNSIYESTFLAIMGPMKPVSDVLCTIYASKLIDETNKNTIETLIKRIYTEVQNATGINIPNADAWITLLLSVCKGKTCEICEKKIMEINNALNDNVIANAVVTTEQATAKVNEEIAKFLTTLDELIGKATDSNSFIKKILDKYKDKAQTIKKELESALNAANMSQCIQTKLNDENKECFDKLKTSLNTIQTDLQSDPDFTVFYDKIQRIKSMLSPQPPQVAGKTRRRRLRRSRRRGTMRNRRRHQHSRQQSKHKNKRE
jgi:hypothetical protein